MRITFNAYLSSRDGHYASSSAMGLLDLNAITDATWSTVATVCYILV